VNRLVMQKILGCQKGVAAVEFAIILPLLLLILFGAVSGFQLYKRDKSVDYAASTVVDLISRFSEISTTDRDAILAIPEVLTSSDDGVVQTRIANIEFRDSQYFVRWSRDKNWSHLTNADLSGLSLPVIGEYDTLLYVEVRVKFSSPLPFDAFKNMNLSSISYARPLLAGYIHMND